MHDEKYLKYRDMISRACDLMFAAKDALDRGDAAGWVRLSKEAADLQQEALRMYYGQQEQKPDPPAE
jgi:hypothetical protein